MCLSTIKMVCYIVFIGIIKLLGTTQEKERTDALYWHSPNALTYQMSCLLVHNKFPIHGDMFTMSTGSPNMCNIQMAVHLFCNTVRKSCPQLCLWHLLLVNCPVFLYCRIHVKLLESCESMSNYIRHFTTIRV